MSKYTTEVRFICEHAAGFTESQDYNKIDQVIAGSLSSIFDFNFPIFDETYRTVLETKILRHYYTREIGLETVGLWKHFLCMRLNEIMPYYNKLYKSELLENGIDFMTDFHETETVQKDSSELFAGFNGNTNKNFDKNANGGASKQVGNESGLDYSIHSDTPQQSLTLDPNSLQYASDTNSVHSSNATTNPQKFHNATTHETANNFNSGGASDSEKSEDTTRTKSGKSPGKSYAELIEDYRRILLNVDMLIIGELESLFMLVY